MNVFVAVLPVTSDVIPFDALKSHEYEAMPLSSVEMLPSKVTEEPTVAVLSEPAFATGTPSVLLAVVTPTDAVSIVN